MRTSRRGRLISFGLLLAMTNQRITEPHLGVRNGVLGSVRGAYVAEVVTEEAFLESGVHGYLTEPLVQNLLMGKLATAFTCLIQYSLFITSAFHDKDATGAITCSPKALSADRIRVRAGDLTLIGSQETDWTSRCARTHIVTTSCLTSRPRRQSQSFYLSARWRIKLPRVQTSRPVNI